MPARGIGDPGHIAIPVRQRDGARDLGSDCVGVRRASQQVYDADLVEHVLSVVLSLIESGRITESRLDASVMRIEGLFGTVE
ncbi:MAG: hypothetical protein V4515_09730 [Chloroflexota bacterium]